MGPTDTLDDGFAFSLLLKESESWIGKKGTANLEISWTQRFTKFAVETLKEQSTLAGL